MCRDGWGAVVVSMLAASNVATPVAVEGGSFFFFVASSMHPALESQ